MSLRERTRPGFGIIEPCPPSPANENGAPSPTAAPGKSGMVRRGNRHNRARRYCSLGGYRLAVAGRA